MSNKIEPITLSFSYEDGESYPSCNVVDKINELIVAVNCIEELISGVSSVSRGKPCDCRKKTINSCGEEK